jgi:mannose-6-phosphate isomerase-like protein (cupin superfamily)
MRTMLRRFLVPVGLVVAGCSGGREEPVIPPAASAPALALVASASAPATMASAPAAPTASAPAAAPPSPIDGALPSEAPPALAERSSCDKGTCALARLAPPEVEKHLDGAATAIVWDQTIADKAQIRLPADEGVEIAGVVLDGVVELHPDDKATPKETLAVRWMGFRAPGAGLSIASTGGKPARVLLALATRPGEGPLAAHLARLDKDAKKLAWKARPKGFGAIDFEKAADLAWGGGAYHARIGWEASGADDHPALVIDTLRFSKDAAVAEHAHDKERECLAVLEGAGELITKPRGPDGPASPIALVPGAVACVDAGVRHAYRPAGTMPLLAIQVYTPPGPEQRFKKLAGKAP